MFSSESILWYVFSPTGAMRKTKKKSMSMGCSNTPTEIFLPREFNMGISIGYIISFIYPLLEIYFHAVF